MDSVIVAIAKYLIYVMVIGFAAVWLWAETRRGKVELALSAVIGLVLVLIFIKVASSSYVDPRPFVVNPSVPPLMPHAPDNGFPSDHSAAAGLMAVLILLRRKWIAGGLFVLGAALIAWARVAAHVHHLLDVGVGLGLGAVAAVLAVAGMTLLVRRTPLVTAGPLGRWVAGAVPGGGPARDPGGDAGVARHRVQP